MNLQAMYLICTIPKIVFSGCASFDITSNVIWSCSIAVLVTCLEHLEPVSNSPEGQLMFIHVTDTEMLKLQWGVEE